jgi:hypothetical protein
MRNSPFFGLALITASLSACNPLAGSIDGSTVDTGFFPGIPTIPVGAVDFFVPPTTDYIASTTTPLATFSVQIESSTGLIISSDSSTTVTLSLSQGTGSLGGTLTQTVSSGIATFSNITYSKAETIVLLATENRSGYSVSQRITVSANHLSKLNFASVPSVAVVGTPISFAVTAKDSYGNTVTNYSGTVGITSSDSAATLPAAHSFSPTDAGTFTFTGFSFGTNGNQTLTASDGAISSLSSGVTVACSAGRQVFVYTSAVQTFIPPTGCTTFSVKMWGAGGGGGASNLGTAYPGGGGGAATSTLTATSAETFTVIVGGGGTSAGNSLALGGYGGGGTGYSPAGYGAGGGGGRSAILLGAAELMTAGGGGGGGSSATTDRTGGAGGGMQGAGGDGVSGAGGTSSAGGAAGNGTLAGTAGASDLGGNGNSTSGGAGGGGGYFGGGGGGSQSTNDFGGGGGGASFVGGSGISAGSMVAGSGVTPGNSADVDLASVALGGAMNQNGSSGRVVMSWGASITAVNPATGDVAGGALITLQGWGFTSNATVAVGGIPCPVSSITSDSQITCVLPAGTLGAADVTVSQRGVPAITLASGFTYVSAGFSGSQTFMGTGGPQTFIPNAGVNFVSIKAWGAGGGGNPTGVPTPGAGGGGGFVSAYLSVTPGQTYTVIVGQGGYVGSAGAIGGGYGGGGTGNNAASGGGRSAIQLADGTELLTAGGGGGGGLSTSGNRNGGEGGGEYGANGGFDIISGGGGSLIGGGVAGIVSAANGSPGTQFTGGAGNATAGAGGGGGYYGGGGGGNGSPADPGGAGGGGSSYWNGAGVFFPVSVSAVGITPGNSTDSDNGGAGAGGGTASNGVDGRVVISW